MRALRGTALLLAVSILGAFPHVAGAARTAQTHASATPGAAISVTPQTGDVEAGTTTTVTLTVEPVGGTIAKGTYTAYATVANAGAIASFVGPYSCTYTDTSPSCTLQLSSPAAGMTRVAASTSVTLNGVSKPVTADTGSSDNLAAGGTGPAVVTWVQGVVAVAPTSSTDLVGSTSSLNVSVGSLGAPIDSGSTTASIDGPGSFVGANSCGYAASSPNCTLQITSSQAGTSVVNVTATMSLGGTVLTRTAAFSETWVDGKITISPASGAVPVNGQQNLTITVAPLGGTLDPGTYTATATVTKPGSFVGPSTCTYTDVQPSCTVTVTASASGTATVGATSSFRVSGVSVKRTAGAADNAAAGGGDRASVVWSGGGTGGAASTPTSGGSPGVSISLSPRSQSVASGGTARFTVTVTNSGTLNLSSIAVSDAQSPHCAKSSGGLSNLTPGATSSYSCSVEGVTTNLTNTATVSALSARGDTVTASDSVTVTLNQAAAAPVTKTTAVKTAVAARARLTVSVTPALQTVVTRVTSTKTSTGRRVTVVHHGTAQFSVRVTNAGNVPLANVAMLDGVVPSCAQKLGKLAVGTAKTITCSRLAVLRGFTNLVAATAKARGKTLRVVAAPARVRVATRH